MTLTKTIFLISVFFTLFACSSTKPRANSCILNKDTNTIKGKDRNAVEIKIPSRIIPGLIELLGYEGGEYNHDKYYNSTKHFGYFSGKRFTGIHIQGCHDTTWAKARMAEHLMEKYHISRYDSVYTKDIYFAEVVDENKIDFCEEPCIYESTGYHTIGKYYMSVLGGLEWDDILSMLPEPLGWDVNEFIGEERIGKYNIRFPMRLDENFTKEDYFLFLRDSMGVEVTYLRTDTIELGVYDYSGEDIH